MKKIKVIPQMQHTNATTVLKAYLVRFEIIGGAFVSRYFKVFAPGEKSEEVLHEELAPFDPGTTPLMRQLVNEYKFYIGSAVTSQEEFATHVMREIGRHIFKPQIGSASVVGSGEKYDFPLYVLPFNGVDSIGEPYNHFVESAQVKGLVNRNGRMLGMKPVFLFHSAKSDAPISDWTICLIDTSAFIFEDLTGGAWETAANFSPMTLLPTVELSAPTSVGANGSATIGVTLKSGASVLQYSGEFTVESVCGYVPNSRVSIVDGVGSFKAMALGLEAGDTMRVKVGTRCITGLAEANITVA